MRHAIGHDETLVSKLAVSSARDADANKSSATLASDSQPGDVAQRVPSISLRRLLPHARFFSADDLQFDSVASSSRVAQQGQLVVYRIGEDEPTEFIAEVLSRGAAGILTEQLLPCPLPQCIVGDVDLATAAITAEQLQRPDRKLLTVGVIGSAGKTTTALLVSSLFRSCGIRTAYQTDLGECDGLVQSTPNEDIDRPADLVRWIGEAVDAQCQVSLIEMSDKKLRDGVFDAIELDVLIMTGGRSKNDDFGPMALQCGLDRLTADGVVIASADDERIIEEVSQHRARLITYGVHRRGDVTARIIEESGGMATLAVSHGDTTAVMESRLCGGAMAANHAAAAALGILIARPLHEIVETLGRLRDVPARQQRMACHEHAGVVIDAGGSPTRVAETLRTMRRMKGRGQLWCVLAIEPDDSDHRLADYGNCMERFADQSIITCRDEGKSHFLSDSHAILDGVQKLASMRLSADRQRAVRWAISSAKPADTVLVIGGITRQSPQAQRSEIEQIVGWVESERQSLFLDDDSKPTILSIFK